MSMAKQRARSPPTNGPVASGRQRSHRDRASLLINDSPSLIDRRRNRSGVGMDTIAELEKVRQGLVRNLLVLSALGNRTGGLACARFACNAPLLHSIGAPCIQSLPAGIPYHSNVGRVLAHSAEDASRAATAATKHEVCYLLVTLCKRDRMQPHRGRILLMMAPTQNLQPGSAVHHARRAANRNEKQRRQPPAKEPLATRRWRSGFGAYELDAHVLGA
jgi:hypothetical protein